MDGSSLRKTVDRSIVVCSDKGEHGLVGVERDAHGGCDLEEVRADTSV
jgi:hypothetical protein